MNLGFVSTCVHKIYRIIYKLVSLSGPSTFCCYSTKRLCIKFQAESASHQKATIQSPHVQQKFDMLNLNYQNRRFPVILTNESSFI